MSAEYEPGHRRPEGADLPEPEPPVEPTPRRSRDRRGADGGDGTDGGDSSRLLWLLAGGLAYTAGVAFFATDARLRYGHSIWHVFVGAGTFCHYMAVAGYAS